MLGPPRARRRSGSCAVPGRRLAARAHTEFVEDIGDVPLDGVWQRSNARAISLLLSPAAILASTSRSRALSGESAGKGVAWHALTVQAANVALGHAAQQRQFGRRQLVTCQAAAANRARAPAPAISMPPISPLSSAAMSAGRIAAAAADLRPSGSGTHLRSETCTLPRLAHQVERRLLRNHPAPRLAGILLPAVERCESRWQRQQARLAQDAEVRHLIGRWHARRDARTEASSPSVSDRRIA